MAGVRRVLACLGGDVSRARLILLPCERKGYSKGEYCVQGRREWSILSGLYRSSSFFLLFTLIPAHAACRIKYFRNLSS